MPVTLRRMSKIRVQVISRRQTDLAVDHIVNSVYFDDFNAGVADGTNWQAFANDVRALFNNRGGFPAGYGVETKVYDMADAKPRPVKAAAPWVGNGNQNAATVPREVALCLSYFSGRNLPRFRGRLYLGPWTFAEERPNAGHMDSLSALALGLTNIGGIDVDWGLWSPTRLAFSKITDTWIDDEWDTIRSRGLRSTTRRRAVTNE